MRRSVIRCIAKGERRPPARTLEGTEYYIQNNVSNVCLMRIKEEDGNVERTKRITGSGCFYITLTGMIPAGRQCIGDDDRVHVPIPSSTIVSCSDRLATTTRLHARTQYALHEGRQLLMLSSDCNFKV